MEPGGNETTWTGAARARLDDALARVALVAHACTGGPDVDEILAMVVRQAIAGVSGARATVARPDPSGVVVPVLSAGADDRHDTLALAEAVVLARVARERTPIVLASPAAVVARFPALDELGPPAGAIAAYPMQVRGTVVAVLSVAFDGTRVLDPVDRVFLHALADVGALALGAAG